MAEYTEGYMRIGRVLERVLGREVLRVLRSLVNQVLRKREETRSVMRLVTRSRSVMRLVTRSPEGYARGCIEGYMVTWKEKEEEERVAEVMVVRAAVGRT